MNTRPATSICLAALLLLASCTGPSATRNNAAEEPTVRVLMVTTTHGFRHGPAIDASKAVMAAMADTSALSVDITENLTALTPENLARYDVLFLANATLRAADDLSEEEMLAAQDPNEGDWGNWDITYQSFRGTTEARVALSGTPDVLTGNIILGTPPQPRPLQDVSLDGQTLRFSWAAGNFGTFAAETTLDGDQMTGTLSFRDRSMPVTGVYAGPFEEEAPSTDEPPRANAAQREAILAFVQGGKGLVVAHAGLDALYAWEPYRTMVGGGLFKEHPWTQEVRVIVEEPSNPAVAHFGEAFTIHDEIYVLEENPRWNARVLASLDMQSVGVTEEPAGPERNDYPISWIREEGQGRVFVTKLGHFAEVWQDAGYQQHIYQGLLMAAGRTSANFSGHRVKEVIAEGVWPDDIAVDERGNVWIAELRGKVHHYDAETSQTRLLTTVATTEPTGIEHGLYGIEVDPNFYRGEPYVYLYYAEQETFTNTLYRYTYRDGQLDLSTETVLLRVPTEPQCCHQAGDLEWGPDGTLYISTGDTGYSGVRPDWEISEERLQAFQAQHNLEDYHWARIVDSERTSQNLTDLRGKILRINKDGSIPKDNPFYGQAGVRWEVYAYGLRNPYRFKVDHQTGALYIGVVGPDAGSDYDEYNISENGGENYGWPRSIGRLFYNEWTPEMIPGYVPPMWEYTYRTGGRSATVGPIYRHDGPYALPAVFQNKLFVYDWSRRWIKWGEIQEGTFTNDQESDVRREKLSLSAPAKRLVNVKLFDQLTLTTPISMELGPDGSLYVAEYDGFWDPGPNARVTRYRWIEDE